MITGRTALIAHLGHPTHAFRAPMIYNPWLERAGADAVVVPMDCRAGALEALLRPLFALDNVLGALVTMPHKVAVVPLLDEASPAVRVAGACNAVRRTAHGRLEGGQFDGEGFVRGARARGCALEGARALVVGCGGVGSAIAASLAGAGVRALALHDARADACAGLAGRLGAHHPTLEILRAGPDPTGFDVVVNATPMGMAEGDPLPFDPERLSRDAFVGEVVMARETTPLLERVAERGCRYQVGTDMLFEMVPAYLEFFGLPVASADELRAVARLDG